jgi:hypothetical protein
MFAKTTKKRAKQFALRAFSFMCRGCGRFVNRPYRFVRILLFVHGGDVLGEVVSHNVYSANNATVYFPFAQNVLKGS